MLTSLGNYRIIIVGAGIFRRCSINFGKLPRRRRLMIVRFALHPWKSFIFNGGMSFTFTKLVSLRRTECKRARCFVFCVALPCRKKSVRVLMLNIFHCGKVEWFVCIELGYKNSFIVHRFYFHCTVQTMFCGAYRSLKVEQLCINVISDDTNAIRKFWLELVFRNII